MSRSVPFWVGKTDDTAVPAHVRLRIFIRHNGICWISGREIGPSDRWDLDHKVALCNGGAHSEDNLAPALRDKHREKTAVDVAERAKIDRIRKRHLGIEKPSRAFPGAKNSRFKKKMNGSVVLRNLSSHQGDAA